ncbi:hypothetical protein GCM10009854_16310 [Saccharopolyspora halophila]|uniref:Uncharacterized protein n=1 Tax=Saccharopolyspora halophila TaxID=405551 RepID=A0ABN3FZ79_9PSEU
MRRAGGFLVVLAQRPESERSHACLSRLLLGRSLPEEMLRFVVGVAVAELRTPARAESHTARGYAAYGNDPALV